MKCRKCRKAKRPVAGVLPFPFGLKLRCERIEAGEQREEVRTGLSKAQAIDAGRQLHARMKGGGWVLHVWQNLGWHYCVRRGPLGVHPSNSGGYFTLLAGQVDGDGGFPAWTSGDTYHNPNRAVDAQLVAATKFVNDYTAQLQAALSAARGTIRG
jgi:hypothetical protein